MVTGYSENLKEYINGYVQAVSRVKDIMTRSLGGFNQFFSVPKNASLDLASNLREYIIQYKSYYETYYPDEEKFRQILDKIELVRIHDWQVELPGLISEWTCDHALSSINGKNGFALSEYLVNFLLKDFFGQQEVKVFRLQQDDIFWHWGDQMGEEYVFETSDAIYILHFGESS